MLSRTQARDKLDSPPFPAESLADFWLLTLWEDLRFWAAVMGAAYLLKNIDCHLFGIPRLPDRSAGYRGRLGTKPCVVRNGHKLYLRIGC